MQNTFLCSDCGETKELQTSGGTGYGIDQDGKKVCYQCCAKRDKQKMVEAKIGTRFTHYLTEENGQNFVGNWCSTFKIPVRTYPSRHNFGGTRYDFWFSIGKEKFWGYQIGEFNQIAHIKKIK